MSAPISLVIFDCDGVLVDTERIAVRIDVAVLAKLGWPMTEAEVIERFMGRSDAEMTAQIEAHLGRPLGASWEEPFRHLYREAFAAELKPVPGILEALDAIAIPTCVASSGTHEKIRYTLGPRAARSSRTARMACKPPGPPGCARSATPEAWPRGARSRARKPLFSTTCGSFRGSCRASAPDACSPRTLYWINY